MAMLPQTRRRDHVVCMCTGMKTMTSSLDASRAYLVSFAWPPTTEADSVTRIRQLERALASRLEVIVFIPVHMQTT